MRETCSLGKEKFQFERSAKLHTEEPDAYIHEHLPTLYFITKMFDCKDVLEIGTGNGASTMAFAEAGARVNTLDILEKNDIKKILDDVVPNQVNFITTNSQDYLPQSVDIIFIDGDHSYEAVKAELEKFHEYAKKFMILHDITNPAHEGVNRALEEFLDNNNQWDFYQWFNCNGLAVLKRKNNF